MALEKGGNVHFFLDWDNFIYLFFIIFSYQLGIPIPETSSGGELKPGSLPNLTNLEIGQAPGGGGGNTVNHSCNSSNTSTAGGPGTIAKDGQESPYSSVSIYSFLSI